MKTQKKLLVQGKQTVVVTGSLPSPPLESFWLASVNIAIVTGVEPPVRLITECICISKSGGISAVTRKYKLHELKRFVRIKFSGWMNKFYALLRKFSWFEKHITVLSSFNWGIRYLTKRSIIAREHERIWLSADKRARCNGIWPSTTECAMTHFLRNHICTCQRER